MNNNNNNSMINNTNNANDNNNNNNKSKKNNENTKKENEVGRYWFSTPSQPFRLYRNETQFISSQVSLVTVPDTFFSLYLERFG